MSIRQRLFFALAAAGFGGLLSAWILHRGMALDPDSWAYWQGSVSLLNGRGYTYFYGDLPLGEWPPLYSCYLTAWQAMLGVSGQTLIIATVVLSALTSFSWTLLMLTPLGSEWHSARPSRTLIVATAISIFIMFFVAGQQVELLSDHLLMALLPTFIGCALAVHRATSPRRQITFAVLAGLCGALLMLTHNRSVVFLAAGACIALVAKLSQLSRIASAAIVVTLGIVPWIIVRKYLGQTSDHPMGWGNGIYSARQYAMQLLNGFAFLLGIRRLFGLPILLLLVILLARTLSSSALTKAQFRNHLLFASLSLAFLFMLFNLIWIDGKLDGRFIWFAVLAAVPIALASSITIHSTSVVLLASLVLISGAIAHVVWLSSPRGAIWNYNSDESAFVIKSNHTIRRDILYHQSASDGTQTIVAPPYYSWIDTLMRTKVANTKK